MSNTNHPANHWTNYLPFPGLDSIAKKAIFIPKTGETLQVCNKRWALFFNVLGLAVTRSPGAASHAFNQVLLDSLFCDGGTSQVLGKIELDSGGALLIADLFSVNLRQTAEYTFRNAVIWKEKHLEDGKHHRSDGPAEIRYYADGSIVWDSYWVNGKRHRQDGPAAIVCRAGGAVERKHYWVDGRLHRLDGPAVIEYREDGSVHQEAYWVDGKEVANAGVCKAVTLRAVRMRLGDYTIQQSAGAVNIE